MSIDVLPNQSGSVRLMNVPRCNVIFVQSKSVYSLAQATNNNQDVNSGLLSLIMQDPQRHSQWVTRVSAFSAGKATISLCSHLCAYFC